MAAVHMDASAILGSTLINEAKEKIQYIKYRPVNFTIPGNSSQYVSLRDFYLFVECHIKEYDALENPVMMRAQPQPSHKRIANEAFGTPEKQWKKRIPNGQRLEEDEKEEEKEYENMMSSGSAPVHITARSQLADLLESAETKYAEAQEA